MANKFNQIVTIYPGYNQFRYSYFVQGILRLFSRNNIIYSGTNFPKFGHHALPIVFGLDPGVKIYISAGDGPGYNELALKWADVYAKRTLITEKVPIKYSSKIIPMGPHLGIRIYGLVTSLYQAVRTYITCPSCIQCPRDHFWNYFKQYYNRLPESFYVPGESKSDYIFYASTLYPTHPEYNKSRIKFIEACLQTSSVNFEGGLIRKDNYRMLGAEKVTIGRYYPVSEWIKKEKASAVGFWAPGDQGAMTLKLGEFLALGKAIIAVPIRQEMLPSPLLHGEQVHFVDGSVEEIKHAIIKITKDVEYRRRLESNARKYYEEWLAPEKAVRRFIVEGCRRAGINQSEK